MRKFAITVNGQSYEVEVEEIGGAPTFAAAPVAAAPAGAKPVNAPMPGTVLDVKVTVGQKVKNGDTLLILEAMKMENEIAAPADGTVASINVSKGATVNTGDLMISLN